MIRYWIEGTSMLPGINWRRDHYSRIILGVMIKPYAFYFRWRSKHARGKRILCDMRRTDK